MNNFKILLLFTLFLTKLGTEQSYAQRMARDSPVIYLELGLGYGTHTEFKAAINKRLDGDKIASIAFSIFSKNYGNVPAGYTSGGLRIIDDGIPNQYSMLVSALYGKVLPQSRCVRVCMKYGISLGMSKYPVFYNVPNRGGWYGSASGIEDEEKGKFTAGLAVNPVVELKCSKSFGISLGLNGNLNTFSPSLCAELNILKGSMR